MKKFILILTLPVLLWSCEGLNLAQLEDAVGGMAAPTSAEASKGLKEALKIGIARGVAGVLLSGFDYSGLAVRAELIADAGHPGARLSVEKLFDLSKVGIPPITTQLVSKVMMMLNHNIN